MERERVRADGQEHRVVVRAVDEHRTRVEAIDPHIMVSVTGNPTLKAVATEARTRLTAALHSLHPSPPRC